MQDQVKLGAKEDLRVHLDCTSAGEGSHVTLTYSVTTDQLGDKFVGLSSCSITTTQVFFPFGKELEIPTESMGCEWASLIADDLCTWPY